ncbi:MAG TPA: hypothetical protein EYN67_08465 [Flavobacteriales bacterium]|jgi:hypothetical protein|nr:hypothetical protein [Flavobacteriales bacterium]
MKISKIHRVPDIILDQISEWSCGGFMLFNFDEDGNPQVYSKVEDERNAMSLQYLVSHWAEAMEDMNAKSFNENINNIFEEEHEEEEEGLDENE